MYLVEDEYQRTFKTLRISLTNACNLGCVYCVHGEELQKNIRVNNNLSVYELLQTVNELKNLLPISTVRLTGGEPTLFKELILFIRGLSELGITNIKMTSNGYLLAGMAKQLASAGLKEVNISLDAIDEEIFYKVSKRKDLHRVLNAIEQCLLNGIQVKINTVIMKGLNDSQILPLLYYAGRKNVTIRFLELMKMGYYYSNEFERYFYPEQLILSKIATHFIYAKEKRAIGSTANYWTTLEDYRFGIIANESSPFCGDCDRLRLDSSGTIYGCLSESIGVSISDVLNDRKEMIKRLKLALSHKQAVRFKGSKLEMIAIGG